MSIPDQIALTAARLLQRRAQGYADRMLRLARHGADRAAERIESAGPRIMTLTEAGLRVTELSCRCIDQLVRQSLVSAQGALTDGAERLRMTARARSLGALYAEQQSALPASKARIAQELQATWTIVASTGQELVKIAQSTREALVSREPRMERARGARSRKPRSPRNASRRRAGPHTT